MIFTELSSDHEADLQGFYHGFYVHQFPDPNERESLENMRSYLELKARGWYGLNNYHIVLAHEEDRLVAACVSDYFHLPNSGVIEFLLVSPDSRGRGHGRAMLDEMIRLFHQDAARAGKEKADCVLGEMNDPFLTHPADDNLDPFERAQIWGRWGFGALDFPYVQPPLDPGKQAVANLLLMARNLSDSNGSLPSAVVKQVIHDYLKWAMRFKDPEAEPNFQRMASFLDPRQDIRLVPLQEYTGTPQDRPFITREAASAAEVQAVMPVYRRYFGSKEELAIDPSEFLSLVQSTPDGRFRYHLWSVHLLPELEPEGMASFFSYPWGGFGGYIALGGRLAGTRRLRPLIARIEKQMLKDYPDGRGWFVECDPDGVENLVFEKAGFERVRVDYRQPDLDDRAGVDGNSQLKALNLLYKPFGRGYAPVTPPLDLLTSMEDVFRSVYGITSAKDSQAYIHLHNQLG